EPQIVRPGGEDVVRLRAQPPERRGAGFLQRILHASARICCDFHRVAREEPPEKTADETAAGNGGKQVHLAQAIALRERLEHAEREGRAANAAAGKREADGPGWELVFSLSRLARRLAANACFASAHADRGGFPGCKCRGIYRRLR